MPDSLIRKVSTDDVVALQEISQSTFSEAFAAYNTPENMRVYLEQNLSVDTLLGELSHPQSSFYFFMDGPVIAGYLKLNWGPAQSEQQKEPSLEIERIYVRKEYYGKSVGQQLLDKALEEARQLGMKIIWLGVWENNHRALRFYAKNGFIEFGKHPFLLGSDEQTDILMKRDLSLT